MPGSSPRAWGTRIQRRRRGPSRPVHPHVRGEHLGSRPSVWQGGRFIPTCVGNTPIAGLVPNLIPGSSPRAWGTRCWTSGPAFQATVHPHVRGEHAVPSLPSLPLPRFIPTCVGNTAQAISAWRSFSGSSPRAWGTRACSARRCRSGYGSSPRAWGTLRSARRFPTGIPVHPHVRGEHGLQCASMSI